MQILFKLLLILRNNCPNEGTNKFLISEYNRTGFSNLIWPIPWIPPFPFPGSLWLRQRHCCSGTLPTESYKVGHVRSDPYRSITKLLATLCLHFWRNHYLPGSRQEFIPLRTIRLTAETGISGFIMGVGLLISQLLTCPLDFSASPWGQDLGLTVSLPLCPAHSRSRKVICYIIPWLKFRKWVHTRC